MARLAEPFLHVLIEPDKHDIKTTFNRLHRKLLAHRESKTNEKQRQFLSMLADLN